MTREEILSLLGMTEEEQIGFLSRNEILLWIKEYIGQGRTDTRLETLPECAFRMRNKRGFSEDIENLYEIIHGKREKLNMPICAIYWWGQTAKPIHWIVAALLAKEGKWH